MGISQRRYKKDQQDMITIILVLILSDERHRDNAKKDQ